MSVCVYMCYMLELISCLSGWSALWGDPVLRESLFFSFLFLSVITGSDEPRGAECVIVSVCAATGVCVCWHMDQASDDH